MALRITVPGDYQFNGYRVALVEAYARIAVFQGDKGRIRFELAVYLNQASRQAGGNHALSIMYEVPTPAEPVDLLPYLYGTIKNGADFPDAVDC